MTDAMMSDVVVARQVTSTTTVEYRIRVYATGGRIQMEVWEAWPGAPEKAFEARQYLALDYCDARIVAESILALLDKQERE